MDNANTNTDDDTKITSIEKKEKVKDPRRVAQEKKLAAISRQAKERKAREREEAAKQAMQEKLEEECFLSKSYAIIPVIGIALGGYYFLCLRNSTKENAYQKDEDQEPKKQKSNLEKL